DDRFDGGAAPHLATDRFRDPAHLAADPHPELLFVIVTAVPLVDMDAAGLDAGLLLQFGDDRSQRMAVKRVSMQRLGVQHELAAFGFCRPGWRSTLCSRTHRAPELCLCRCTRPRGHAANKPWDRAGGDPESAPAPPRREDGRSAPSASRCRRSCGGYRGSPDRAECAGT